MRRFIVAAAVVGFIVLPAAVAAAHPLGNFTINQYSGLDVQSKRVVVHYVLDMAEIPTFQTRPSIDTNGDGTISRAENAAYRRSECGTITRALSLTVAGSTQAMQTSWSRLTFPPGAAGLHTLRLECDDTASFAAASGPHAVEFRNANFAGRIGWREITAVGDGATLASSNVPRTSVSHELTHYPTDLLSSPLDVLTATLRVTPGGSADAPAPVRAQTSILPRGVDATTQAFMSLVARRELTLAFAVLALVLAVALGAIHALAPGHGKSVMAAYLVGQRGSLRQASAIGLTVTVTHTAGVLVLGLALTSTAIVPERLYPLLGFASGAMLFGIGVSLLRRTRRRVQGHVHEHEHGPHTHTHDDARPPVSPRGLIAMGFAGGLVPSPSALVVLLGAIALHRAWFGFVLVVAYGIGMAGTLTAAGLLLVRARAKLDRRTHSGFAGHLARAVPVLSASVVCVVGLVLAVRAAIAI